jgi:hypothetical protein
LKIEWIDERDDYEMTEYEYKKATRNVNRKQIIERVQPCNMWYHPMIDIMLDGVEFKPTTILRRAVA